MILKKSWGQGGPGPPGPPGSTTVTAGQLVRVEKYGSNTFMARHSNKKENPECKAYPENTEKVKMAVFSAFVSDCKA